MRHFRKAWLSFNFIKSISLGFITKYDRETNDNIRKQLQVDALRNQMRMNKLRWYSHVLRRDDEYIGKKVRKMHFGTRKKERPKRRLEDCVNEDMKTLGIRVEDTANRRSWRRRIHTGDPTDTGI